jgi:hypothetical protein
VQTGFWIVKIILKTPPFIPVCQRSRAALKPPQSRRYARFENRVTVATRLDCGGFSTAFCTPTMINYF